jgi:hypothetical protein
MRIKATQLIHLSFCTAILLFAGAIIFILGPNLKFDFKLKDADGLELVAPIVAVLGMLMSSFLFKKLIGEVDVMSSPTDRFMKFQTAFLVKCALLEAGALINIVACFISGNAFFLIFASAPFFVLWASKPTKDKVYTILQLQDTDSLDGI